MAEPRTGEERDPATPLPPAWGELIGAGPVLAEWRRLVAADRLPQVMLVTGREGTGKRALLAALAAMHVCETGTACGGCRQCQWLLAGAHPEVLWVQSVEGKLLTDDAAALQDHLSLSAGADVKARVAVVVDVDQFNLQALNRLLKTLEEPPARTRILLSSSRADALPDTVRSRCVRWRVSPPAEAESRRWLAARLDAMGRPADDALLSSLLKRSGLAPGRALKLAAAEPVDARPLFAVRRLGDGLEAAAQLAKDSGLTAAELLALAEMQLNDSYASSVAGGERPGLGACARIRATLRQAKALAIGGKVPLNAQLLLESLAAARFDGPSTTRPKA